MKKKKINFEELKVKSFYWINNDLNNIKVKILDQFRMKSRGFVSNTNTGDCNKKYS